MLVKHLLMLSDLERIYGTGKFNHHQLVYPYPVIVSLHEKGYLERLSKREWRLTPEARKYLAHVKARFNGQ